MADVTFLNLLRGNRLSGFLRMRMASGSVYRLAKDYTYAELPLSRMSSMDGEAIEGKALRNQTIELFAPTTLQPINGYKALVVANPLLYRFASVAGMTLVDASDTEIPISVIARFTRDFDPTALDWLCRVYLIS